MLVKLLLLIPIGYVVFVFTSGAYNPFVRARGPLKKRSRQLGRAAAFASIIAGSVAIIMVYVYKFEVRVALLAYLLLVALIVVPSVIKYRKNSIWR